MGFLAAGLKSAAADTARRGAWIAGGGVALLVGAGFATLAAWLVLDAMRGPLYAALVLCLAYFGLGFVLLSLGLRHRRRETLAAKVLAAEQAMSADSHPDASIEVQVMEATLRLQALVQSISEANRAPAPEDGDPVNAEAGRKAADIGIAGPLLAAFVIGLDLARLLKR
jgi:hypothetical protein